MNTIRLELYIQPGAAKTEIAGAHDGRVKIRLKASPVEGQANKALIAYIANILHIKKSDVKILQGEKSRYKVLSVPSTARGVKKLLVL